MLNSSFISNIVSYHIEVDHHVLHNLYIETRLISHFQIRAYNCIVDHRNLMNDIRTSGSQKSHLC
jgi:hypothetical protein